MTRPVGFCRTYLLRCGSVSDSKEQARNTDVFVELIPVQARAATTNEMVLSLFGSRTQQSREVREWD